MLAKFEVTNMLGFGDNIVFDFHTNKKYATNLEFVDRGIIKKALVYGSNGSGKSNMCNALMDIVVHITDHEKILLANDAFLCANKNEANAVFKYHFRFGRKKVVYEYAKITCQELCYEKLFVGDELVLEYNYHDDSHNVNKISGAENLNAIRLQPQLSMIKYIYNNTVQGENSIIKQLVDFVNGMLYFKSLLDGNRYMGFKLGGEDIADSILKQDKLGDFQKFLNDMGLDYQLVPIRRNADHNAIGIKFGSGKVVEFSRVVSSGTKTLWLFYFWLLHFEHLKFLVIDEFDAYYHYDLSAKVLSRINRQGNFQSVITTHNTFLMNKTLTRPDCCFVIKDSKVIKPICKLTKKEIRSANNVEKMFRDGEFVDW